MTEIVAKPKVFFSYSYGDRAWAQRFAGALTESGITVWAGDCGYDISKAGLNMLSDHIAVEYGARGIRSNTLMPGVIRTELHESVMEAMNDGRAFERELLGRHPIGRFGSVDEVAAACVFLCDDAAGFMTGANISIDGGYSRV